MKRLLAAVLAMLALAVSSPAMAADTPTLDPVKVAEIERLSVLLDKLPQKTYPITFANSGFFTESWEVEILPWFGYEGVADPVIPPQTIEFYFGAFGPKAYIDGYVFHVLGLSQCEPVTVAQNPFDGGPTPVAGPIFLNGRYINPASPWYQRPDFVAVLTHELAHSQGICVGDSPYVESSTQLVTLEVLSAMANAGNDQVLLSLIEAWRGITLGALKYEALRDGIHEQYEAVKRAADRNSPRERAISEASTRFWNRNTDSKRELKAILEKYEWSVYKKAKYALETGFLKGCRPPGCGPLMRANAFVPSGKNLVMNDFAYFLKTADERVAEVAGGRGA